jgi:hypothetical protein
MTNLKIIFVDGREDLIVPYPTSYSLGHYWSMFQYLSELLRTRCIHEDEIKDVTATELPEYPSHG